MAQELLEKARKIGKANEEDSADPEGQVNEAARAGQPYEKPNYVKIGPVQVPKHIPLGWNC